MVVAIVASWQPLAIPCSHWFMWLSFWLGFQLRQEALWRLDEVLESAMAGVRLGDGTTWVKSRGYTWVLGSYMAAKLYPQGETSTARFLGFALSKRHLRAVLD